MSGTWWTHFYFAPHRECSLSFCREVVNRFLADDCSFLNPNVDFSFGSCWSLDGLDNYEAPSLEAGLAWIVSRGMGAIQLWHLPSQVDFSVSLNPCGRAPGEFPTPEGSSPYGWSSLWLDQVYLKGGPADEMERNYRLVYQWSSLLASVVAPIYGWGDLELYQGVVDLNISTLDLDRRTIPRLSWWNYFSTGFLEHLQEGQLSTYVAWLDYRDEQGRTVILHPPAVPVHGTGEALTLIAPPNPWQPE